MFEKKKKSAHNTVFLNYNNQNFMCKSFCTAKEINKTKRQPMEWEKIFADDETNKELISKV